MDSGTAGRGRRPSDADPPPLLRSLALRDCASPDHVDVLAVRCPSHARPDPAAWARHVFSVRSMPPWVVALLGVRQLAVRLVGIDVARSDVFDVDAVEGDEALIAEHSNHLDFWAAVGIDPAARLLWLTTAVRLHNRRGRLYWSVVRFWHPVVVTAMLRRAVRTAAAADLIE